jgi:hypothetical protein
VRELGVCVFGHDFCKNILAQLRHRTFYEMQRSSLL